VFSLGVSIVIKYSKNRTTALCQPCIQKRKNTMKKTKIPENHAFLTQPEECLPLGSALGLPPK